MHHNYDINNQRINTPITALPNTVFPINNCRFYSCVTEFMATHQDISEDMHGAGGALYTLFFFLHQNNSLCAKVFRSVILISKLLLFNFHFSSQVAHVCIVTLQVIY
jgi:hypothetical protein